MFDRFVSIAMFIIGAATVYASGQLPKPIFAGQLGPGVFPMGVGYGIILISVLLFLESQKQAQRKSENQTSGLRWNRRFWMSVGVILLYLLIFKPIGFILSGCLLIFAFGWLLGAKKWVPLLSISILFPAAIYFGFHALGLNLPSGILPI